jgi:hypothetical protein
LLALHVVKALIGGANAGDQNIDGAVVSGIKIEGPGGIVALMLKGKFDDGLDGVVAGHLTRSMATHAVGYEIESGVVAPVKAVFVMGSTQTDVG